MNHLLELADPATDVQIDKWQLRALVDERIGVEPIARPRRRPSIRPWTIVATTFAIVVVTAVPSLLNRGDPSQVLPDQRVAQLPGVIADIPLASGGVQTMAVEGSDIWVVTALASELQRISIASNRIEETFEIDGYVEGVIPGGGYLWLLSYDNGGEVLRFDPSTGAIDKAVSLGGLPGFARWFGGHLFANNDQGEFVEISSDGSVLSRTPGTVRGVGFDFLWVFDPADRSIRSVASDGATGEFVIPGSTPEFGDLSQVRLVSEAGSYLWLIFGETSEGVGRFDLSTGELQPLHVGRWLHSMTEHDGALWATSYSDHVLFRVDPSSGDVRVFALPGRPGGIASVNGELWILLYQPGSLLRVDPSADLVEMTPEVAAITSEAASGSPHNLVCTLGGVEAEVLERVQVDRDFTELAPTIVLEGPSWMGIGIWSVVQAQIEGRVVCASGRTGEGGTPQQRAVDLESALSSAGVAGPFVLVAAGDGIHTLRVFAQGREDIAGVVLVEPIPLGFEDFYDDLFGDGGHPPWLDLDPAVSDSLADLGDLPLVILSHEPNAVFLAEKFVESVGEDRARRVSDYWEQGIDFYAGFSTNSRRVSVPDTGFDGVLWFKPDLVVDAIRDTR